jgi:hypothetical protein
MSELSSYTPLRTTGIRRAVLTSPREKRKRINGESSDELFISTPIHSNISSMRKPPATIAGLPRESLQLRRRITAKTKTAIWPFISSDCRHDVEAIKELYRESLARIACYPIVSRKDSEDEVSNQYNRMMSEVIARRNEQWKAYVESFRKKFFYREQTLQQENAGLSSSKEEMASEIRQLNEQLEESRGIQFKVDDAGRRNRFLEKTLSEKERELEQIREENVKLRERIAVLLQQQKTQQQEKALELAAAREQEEKLKEDNKERRSRVQELVEDKKELLRSIKMMEEALDSRYKIRMDEYEQQLKDAAEIRKRLEIRNQEMEKALQFRLQRKEKEDELRILSGRLRQEQDKIRQQQEELLSQQQISAQLKKENDELQQALLAKPSMSLTEDVLRATIEEEFKEKFEKMRIECSTELDSTKRSLKTKTRMIEELKEELERSVEDLDKAAKRNTSLSMVSTQQTESFMKALQEERTKRMECEETLRILMPSTGELQESIVASSSKALIFNSVSSPRLEEKLLSNESTVPQIIYNIDEQPGERVASTIPILATPPASSSGLTLSLS